MLLILVRPVADSQAACHRCSGGGMPKETMLNSSFARLSKDARTTVRGSIFCRVPGCGMKTSHNWTRQSRFGCYDNWKSV